MAHTLLLADDSVTIQRVIELTFADEDVNVLAVSDGDQAIAAIDQRPPDIVLADVGMPGRDGYQVAQHVKSTPRLSHIPVVLLTGAFEPIDQARAAQIGCDGVLAKPFEPQLVIGRVKELLAKGRQPAPANGQPLAAPSSLTSDAAAAAPARAAAPALPSDDSYFERLDEAFANLSTASRPAPPAVPAVNEGGDWFSTPAPAPGLSAPAPVPSAAPAPPFASNAAAARREAPAREADSPSAPIPVLADAFAALLAAEQNTPLPAGSPVWPPVPPAPPPDKDEIVADVTRRVLEQLTDRVVRETVREIVASVAERLVREEIERIKASLR